MPEWSEASLAFLISIALEFGKKMLVALQLFWIGRNLIRDVMKFCNRIFERSRLDLGVITFLRNLINISLQVILIVIIADYLGLQTSSLVAVIGSAGLTLGLALQGSLANLAGGVLLLILKPFRVGDYIVACGSEGVVTGMDIFYTRLLSADNRLIVIPNGTLSNSSIINVTNEPKRRLDIKVGIDYSEDIRKVKAVLQDVIDVQEMILPEEEKQIYVSSFDASAITIGVRVWVETENYWLLKWELMEKIKYAFDESQITIPFDQLDVNVNQKP